MTDRLPLSVRETLRIARLHCDDGERGSIDLAEQWIMAGTYELSKSDLAWLREYFIDTYNTEWATTYQLELVGEVPDAVLRWAGTDRVVVCTSCRGVGDGQYSITVTADDGTKSTYCEDCIDKVPAKEE